MPANTVIKLRSGTAEQWTAANPVLAVGEMGYVTDSISGESFKIGDGSTDWNSLVFQNTQGPEGIPGPGGAGLDAGGTAGQIIIKDSSTDYDTSWTSEVEGNVLNIKTRRDTQANWTSTNPVLAAGEMGYETDTGLIKHGDGANAYNSLGYSASSTKTYLVANQTGSTILKGTLVGAIGAESTGRIDVAPFEVTGGQDSELRAMGLALTDIANAGKGTVISFGTLRNIDTRGNVASALAVGDETWASGDILFAHPTVDGKLTKVRPQHDLTVALVTKVDATTGQIAIRINPGNNHLEWLHDVEIDSPADNEVLGYDSASSLWKNQTAAEAGLATASHTHTFSSITSKPTTISGYGITDALQKVDPTLARVGGSEGGQINFQPASFDPGAKTWAIDSYGGSSTPNLRFIEGTDTRVTFSAGGDVNLSGKIIATGVPYIMAAGTVSSFSGSASVTFPAGRFTQAPIVTATMASSTTVTSATVGSVTTSGFTIYAWAGGSASVTGRAAYYQAIQMTSGAAAG